MVLDDGEHIAFLSQYPTVYGYLLVAPKRHVEHVFRDLTLLEYGRLWAVVHRVARALESVVPSERTYVLSLGSQQGNPHVHIHVVPLPPGTPYEQQQFHALMTENGVVPLTPAQTAALGAALRTALAEPERVTERSGRPGQVGLDRLSIVDSRDAEPVQAVDLGVEPGRLGRRDLALGHGGRQCCSTSGCTPSANSQSSSRIRPSASSPTGSAPVRWRHNRTAWSVGDCIPSASTPRRIDTYSEMPGIAVDAWVTTAPLTDVTAVPPTGLSADSVSCRAVDSRWSLAAPMVPCR